MPKPPPRPAQIDAANLRHVPSVEKFFAKLHGLLQQPVMFPLPLIVELRRTSFIFPEGTLAIICAARLWHRHTGGQRTILQMSEEVHGYLDRIDLFSTCQDYFEPLARPAEPFARTSSKNLLEVIEFSNDVNTNAEQIPSAVDRAYQILYRDFEPHIAGVIGTIFTEIAANIPHSGDVGYAVIQRYPKSNTIHIGIADLGRGIESNLKPNPACAGFANGSDYILRAIEGGVTSRIGEGGMGLLVVNDKVQNGQGVLSIRSGSSLVQIYQNGDPNILDDLPFIPGVQVFLSVYGVPDEWRYS